MCSSVYSQALGCWSSNDPAKSNLKTSLTAYSSKVPNNKAPVVPSSDTGIGVRTYGMGQRVLIFGCDSVATKVPIVNVPNRVATSGHSGHYTLKGAINMRYSPVPGENPEQQYIPEAVQAIFDNAQASLPTRNSGDGSFATCIACLYYARAKKENDHIKNNCPQCWTNYCWQTDQSDPNPRV
jgi:hypothetical protein